MCTSYTFDGPLPPSTLHCSRKLFFIYFSIFVLYDY